jgi:hypothetical protein
MPIQKRVSWIATVLVMVGAANASTLTFVPQPDIAPGTTNHSWFSSANWFITDGSGNLSPAGRVPQANDAAIITSLTDAGTTGVRVRSLLLTNNAAVSNGTFAAENLQMLSGSSLNRATVNVLVFLNVGGTNCTLNDAVLNILAFASATVAPVSPATSSTLILAQGSLLQNFGLLDLANGSQIISGASPQSTLSIPPGGVLSSSGLTYIRGSASGPLLVDNSSLIRVDDGTLRFDTGLDWHCDAGTGEFRAASTNSLIVFGSGFHADIGTVSLFSGSGTNIWSSASSIDGTAQVGAIDPDTQAFSTGHLEILASGSGVGDLHILGSAAESAVLNWVNGTLSLAAVNVDPKGMVLITGGNGTSRQLSGCALNNSGMCTLLSGDLALAQGAAINNLVGGTFLLLADGTFSGAPAPTGGAFNNSGTFRKSSPGVTQFGAAGPVQGPDFNNSGRVEIVSGQLNLLGGVSSGQFQTEAGAVLWFWGGTHTLNTGASFIGAGSVRLYQGFSAPQWLVSGGVSAAKLELGNNGLLVGLNNVPGTPITIETLIAYGNATLSNGTYSVQAAELLDGSTFIHSTMNVLSNLNVGGTNCTLNGTVLNILSTASAKFAPVSPATLSTLVLEQGSALRDSGTLDLTSGTQIVGGTSPQSTLTISPGAVLSSIGLTYIRGSAAGPLLVDNSGLVRVDDGTLRFDTGLDWHCDAGTGEFRAASTNSLIVFGSGFHADIGTVSLFTGSGTNIWSSASSIDGTAQVGSPALSAGNLDILASCSGLGNLHIMGSTTQSAVLNWSDGTLSLAEVNVDPKGTLLITGGNGTSRQLSGCALNNSGVCTLLSGDLALAQGAAVNNLVGGTFQLLADGTFSGGPAPTGGAFNNSGTFRKNSAGASQFGTVSAAQGPDFNNSGLVDIVSGQLNLLGGVSSGQFRTEAGAVLWFWGGTHTLNAGASFSGAGSVRLYQGLSAPQWLVSGGVAVTELELGNNGTISGPGALAIGNTLFWTNGIIQSNGALNISPGARLSILGPSGKTLLQRTINNQGNIFLVNQATVECGAGAILNNLSSGTIDIQTDATISFNNAGQRLVIHNAGDFVKSAGAGITSIDASLNNSGNIEVKAGTLDFQGSWTQTQGSTIIESGNVLGGRPLTIGGGSLGGTGIIQAKVINGGITSPGGFPGILSLGPGADYEQLANGVLLAELGGHIAGTQYDQLAVGDNVSLAGVLELHLINGFVPQPGDQFQILTCVSQTGRFSQISAPQISGAVWVAHYAGTSVSAVLANEVILGQPKLSRGTFSFSFKTTPGLDYVVQQSAALSPANWQTFKIIPGDGTIQIVSDQASKDQRFYRVLIQ